VIIATLFINAFSNNQQINYFWKISRHCFVEIAVFCFSRCQENVFKSFYYLKVSLDITIIYRTYHDHTNLFMLSFYSQIKEVKQEYRMTITQTKVQHEIHGNAFGCDNVPCINTFHILTLNVFTRL